MVKKEIVYESPEIEVVGINVEKGFATSGDGEDGNEITWQDTTNTNTILYETKIYNCDVGINDTGILFAEGRGYSQ